MRRLHLVRRVAVGAQHGAVLALAQLHVAGGPAQGGRREGLDPVAPRQFVDGYGLAQGGSHRLVYIDRLPAAEDLEGLIQMQAAVIGLKQYAVHLVYQLCYTPYYLDPHSLDLPGVGGDTLVAALNGIGSPGVGGRHLEAGNVVISGVGTVEKFREGSGVGGVQTYYSQPYDCRCEYEQ